MVESQKGPMRAFSPVLLALVPLALPAAAQQASPKPPPVKDAMTFELVTNDPDAPADKQQRWVAASGGIVPETGKAFEDFLKTVVLTPDIPVVLDSKGGSIQGGLRLGEAMRKAGASVTVGRSIPVSAATPGGKGLARHQLIPRLGRCFSSCTYAFLGGVKRTIPAGAAYGVHMFWPSEFLDGHLQRKYDYREIERAQRLSALIAVYIQKMGVDLGLLQMAANTPPKVAIRRLTAKEIVDLKIATMVEPAPVFAAPGSWGIAGTGTGATLSTGGTATLPTGRDIRYVLELSCNTAPGFVDIRYEQTPANDAAAAGRLTLRKIMIASGNKDAVVARQGKDIRPQPAAFPVVGTDKAGVWIGRFGTVMDEVLENAAANPREPLAVRLEDGEGRKGEFRLPPGNLATQYRFWKASCAQPRPAGERDAPE